MIRFLFWFLLIFLVFFRYFSTKPVYKDGQKIRMTTTVTSEPIRYSYSQRFLLDELKIYLPAYPIVHYGDRVIVEGRVFLKEKRLEEAVLIRREESDNFLYGLRQKMIENYTKALPEPHASLVAGIVLGAKNMPADFWQKLTRTGVAHVVVASGMNVTMVAGFLIGLAAIFLPRRKAIPVALAGIAGYTVLSGFDAPIVRAAIMGTIAYVSQEWGRVVSAVRALVLSALLMLLIWPNWLVDIGFILSFVATAAILVFRKGLDDRLKLLPKIIKEDFSTTLAAQIGVSPILFVTFGQFNILSPFINVLVLWTVPLIMIIGGLGGLAGLLYEPLGRLILYLAYPLTGWFVSVVSLFS